MISLLKNKYVLIFLAFMLYVLFRNKILKAIGINPNIKPLTIQAEPNTYELTVSQDYLDSIADSIYLEFSSNWWVSTDTVVKLLVNLTSSELSYLFEVFAKREYKPYFWSDSIYLTLHSYFDLMFSESEKQQLKDIFKNSNYPYNPVIS